MASGKANPHSDIDVLLIGTLSFAEAVQLLYPLQQQAKELLLAVGRW